MSDGALINNQHADTLSFTETVTNINGKLTIEGTGATISATHADTLSLDETVVNIGGSLSIGTNPTMSITAIDTMGTGRWVKITIAGATFWACSDTAVVVED